MKKYPRVFFVTFLSIFILASCISSPSPTLAPTQAAPATVTPLPPTAVPPTDTLPPPTATPPPPTATPQPAVEVPWWEESVFYEIFVRSFSDSNGDGIGDFNGITQKLDYLNDGDPNTTTDLGVNALWLMPIYPSPSYHGYDVTDYFTANPDYGTLDDLKNLLAEAHKRGIHVILDMVLNHTSSQHPWFRASTDPSSPYRDWYIWSDTNPGYLGPLGEKVWHQWNSDGYYYGIFDKSMPDLNYRNSDVTAQMEDVARFWLQDVGVDGFRLDGAGYLIEDGQKQANTPETHSWWKNYYNFYKAINPQAMTVGEIWTSNFAVAPYIKDNEMDLAFNFDLASAFIKSVSSGDPRSARDNLKISAGLFPYNQYGTFLTNHDQDRTMSQLGGDVAKAKTAAGLLLTSPGVPFIYYGEEIGMTGQKPDEQIRTPMQWSADAQAGFTSGTPWEPLNQDYAQTNVASQAADSASLLSLYRDLIRLRSQHPALQVGDYLPVMADSPSILAYLRASQGEIDLVVANLGADPVSQYSLTLASGPLSGAYQAVTLMETPASAAGGTLTAPTINARGGFDGYQPGLDLPANGMLVIQLKPAG